MKKVSKKNPLLLLGLIWFFVLASPIYAYLDPGTGSMFLQLLMGGIAGVLVIAKMYWKKLLEAGWFRSKNNEDNAGEQAGNINSEEI